MADGCTPESQVDETPIRPDATRKDSLEKHLAQRPERQELVDSTYPRPAPWPSQSRAPARLPTLLTCLAPPENILSASTAAPGLQAQQKELAKHMRADVSAFSLPGPVVVHDC